MSILYKSEAAVLGSLIFKPDLIDDLYIQPHEFIADDRHSHILKTIQLCYDAHATIDVLLIGKSAGDAIGKLGGSSYLIELFQSVPDVNHFEHYQDIIRNSYIQRETVTAMEDMANAARMEGIDVKAHIGKGQARLEELSELSMRPQGSGVIDMSELFDGHAEELNERRKNKGMMGAKTLSKEVDRLTGGHRPEDFEVVAARPSIGKTAYLVCDAIESRKDGKTPLIFSAEMSKKQIMERFICAVAGLDNTKLRSGMLDEKDWERYSYAEKVIRDMGIKIDDTAGMTIPYIRSVIKKLVKKFPNLIVYIDYLQLISGGRSFGTKREEIDYVSRSLKLIARQFKITVVALAQLSRKVEERQDKRPMMSDIKESGNIEQDADIITFLYRDDYYNKETEKKSIVELIIAKGRNIGTGTVEMVFQKNIGKFIDLDRSHHGEATTAS